MSDRKLCRGIGSPASVMLDRVELRGLLGSIAIQVIDHVRLLEQHASAWDVLRPPHGAGAGNGATATSHRSALADAQVAR